MRFFQKFERELSTGAFSALRVIKIADSSQTSCLNWQAMELLRKLLVAEGDKNTRTFIKTRKVYQKTQIALEETANKYAPVTIKGYKK